MAVRNLTFCTPADYYDYCVTSHFGEKVVEIVDIPAATGGSGGGKCPMRAPRHSGQPLPTAALCGAFAPACIPLCSFVRLKLSVDSCGSLWNPLDS